MKPPNVLNVLDKHNGFTAITKSLQHVAERVGPRGIYLDVDNTCVGLFTRWVKVYRENNMIWRPGQLLYKGTFGTLVWTDEHSFFQTNNNVTKAIYKVPGYRLRIATWFDNVTGERIA